MYNPLLTRRDNINGNGKRNGISHELLPQAGRKSALIQILDEINEGNLILVIDSEKQCPEISLSDDIIREYKAGDDEEIIIRGEISLDVFDNKVRNSVDNMSVFYYNRDDAHSVELDITAANDQPVLDISIPDNSPGYFDDHFTHRKEIRIKLNKDDLWLNEGIPRLAPPNAKTALFLVFAFKNTDIVYVCPDV